MWTQLRMDYLKGGVMAARIGLVRGLANGVARFGLWAEEESRRLEITMSKNKVAVLDR